MTTSRAGEDFDRQVDDHGREFIAARRRFPANAWGFLVTPLLWFAYFIAVYALQGVGCAVGLDEQRWFGVTTLRMLLLFVTGVTVAGMLLFGMWSFRSWYRLLDELEEEERQVHGHSVFLAYGALLHAGLFLVATLWTGLPILLVDSCDLLGSS